MKNRYGFKQKDDGTLELYIYEEIEADSFDWWTGKEIESETSANFIKKKLDEYKNATSINIYINSWGGDVKEAYAICSQLQRHPAYKTAYIDGFAASAASLIPMVCQKVIMPSNTMMMIHRIASYFYGNADEMRKEADVLDTMMEANINLYMNRCNIAKDELKSMIDNETWLTATQCLDLGLCDEIIDGIDIAPAQHLMQKHNESLGNMIVERQLLEKTYKEFSTIEVKPVIRLEQQDKQKKPVACFFNAVKERG